MTRLLLYGLILVPLVGFIALYWTGFPGWWRSRAGRMLMALAGSLSAVIVFVILVQFADISEGTRGLLRLVFLGAVAVACWLLPITLLLERRDARRGDCPKRRSTDL